VLDFLFSLSPWPLAVVLNLGLVSFALASLWGVRRWLLPQIRISSNASLCLAAAAMQSAIVLYALVAALTAVSVSTKHSQVSDTVSSEATAIASVWRDLGGYPQPERDALREVLRGYTNQIIHEAWPEQRQGRIPTTGVVWMDRLLAQLLVFEPKSEAQKALHAQTLSAFNHMHEARRQRLDAVNTALPRVMWLVLLPGAMGCLLLCLIFPVEDARFHAIVVIGLAGFMAMVLFVIFSLDRPLHGPMAIPADSYQLVYDQLMKR